MTPRLLQASAICLQDLFISSGSTEHCGVDKPQHLQHNMEYNIIGSYNLL